MKRDLVRHHLRYGGGDGPSPYLEGILSQHLTRGGKEQGDEQSSPLFLTRPFAGYSVVLLPGLLAGCSRAPTFDIVGSLFPAWIVCLVLGILAAILTRWLLLRLKVTLVLPVLLYPSLAAFFTFLLWLIFFS
jgi:hypothetical protein